MSSKAAKDLGKSPAAGQKPKGAPSPAVQQAASGADAGGSASALAEEKWPAEKEVLLLRTFLKIVEDSGVKPSYEQIHDAMQGAIPEGMDREKVGSKLRGLKRKFLRMQSRASPPRDDPVHLLSEKIWGADAEPGVSAAVSPKAKPTPKRKVEKTPAVDVAEEEAAVDEEEAGEDEDEEEDTARPRKSPRGHNATPVPKPTPMPKPTPTPKTTPAPKPASKSKGKNKKTPTPVVPQDEEQAVEEAAPRKSPRYGNTTAVPKQAPKSKSKKKKSPDVAAPPVSELEDAGTDHNTTPTPGPKKGKTELKGSELVAAGPSATETPEVNSYMLSGLVRILQQVYPEIEEKAVFPVLESMDAPSLEEFKKKWQKLQVLKLEVASLTGQLAMELAQALC